MRWPCPAGIRQKNQEVNNESIMVVVVIVGVCWTAKHLLTKTDITVL